MNRFNQHRIVNWHGWQEDGTEGGAHIQYVNVKRGKRYKIWKEEEKNNNKVVVRIVGFFGINAVNGRKNEEQREKIDKKTI